MDPIRWKHCARVLLAEVHAARLGNAALGKDRRTVATRACAAVAHPNLLVRMLKRAPTWR
jgi:hypothetical protein